MSELLPARQAMRLRKGLIDYLTTTFALADASARAALTDFLGDEDDGMFKGPYLRTGMPFSAAPRRAVSPLDWMPTGFVPYAHQAATFRRLSSRDRRPQPTLVTTGTGSGKTEAFLLPILDHCLRERRAGRTGMKALILYPMNALANDQAQRLAELITAVDERGNQPLASVTAALYTGEATDNLTLVTAGGDGRPASLITDRAIIRDEAPDILLTNYKMLDQLLLRADDQRIWQQSADSLTYLVLDEFHTYDGAQGTDVAMLLRRLGFALKSHWPPQGSSADAHSAEEWKRPLGRITPVGTSATLGPGDDGVAPRHSIVDFATRVFGESFDEASAVGEQRQLPEDWSTASPDGGHHGVTADVALQATNKIGEDASPDEITRVVAAALSPDGAVGDPAELLRRHPLVRELLESTRQASHVSELADLIDASPGTGSKRAQFILAVFNALGHLRATGKNGGPDRKMPSTEVHLWLREVTRLDRYADTAARFRWGDDGYSTGAYDATGETSIAFPAIYCRGCGRSGWGVELAPTGTNLAASDTAIRRNHAAGEGRFRALLNVPEGETDRTEGIMWFDPYERYLSTTVPEAEDDVRQGRLLRVLTHRGSDDDELSRNDTCPSCHLRDGIRFVGSAIATLMSVSLATLFGEPGLNEGEKKALVFTDSVQDAAHRAGFVSSRSHTLTMRSVWREAGDEPRSLPELVDHVIALAGDDPFRRYRIVPPSIREDVATQFWRDANPAITQKLHDRLLLDLSLEFGLVGSYGRTMERTATMSAHVDAGTSEELLDAARAALAEAESDLLLDQTSDTALIAWVRGILQRMRTQGAIIHPWLKRYLHNDGTRWQIWGGRPERTWMPAFPEGRSAPSFPRVGGATGAKSLLDSVTSSQSWYASWTRRCLQLSPTAGASLSRLLLGELAKREVVVQIATRSDARVYGLVPEKIIVAPCDDDAVAEGKYLLLCDVCHSEFPVGIESGEQLLAAPCMAVSCSGRLRSHAVDPGNYYRLIYQARDARRVNAREHTSLLDRDIRLAYENGFKRSTTDPAAPNVLVATPTLEMGIDIGDLSSVFLASLPRTVANYVQRVGRAGRLSGNAFNVAFAQGRGDFLPRLGDPLSLINGAVVAPATYLSAEEILRRQWIAHIADEQARDADAIHPRTSSGALALPGAKDTYLGQLIERSATNVKHRLTRFLEAFCVDGVGESSLRADAIARLQEWVLPKDGPSPLASGVAAAADRWHLERQEIEERLKELNQQLPELETRAQDSDDDHRALRETQAEIKFLGGQLWQAQGDYWIGALERLGLLPNYSLIDDSVRLDVTMSWIDEDEGYQAQQADYSRGSSQALSDFAPGATFYAHGLQIAIDAVDIGHQGSAIRTVRLCPDCGYVAEHGASPQHCPRCDGVGIADVGQRFETVELSKVSAYIRRDEARIDDRDDERNRTSFSLVAAADLDPNKVQESWFTSTDTGVKYFRGIDLRWFNVGARRHTAPEIRLGGYRVKAPQFRICAGCGHLDRASLSNARDEHRPWCSMRTSHTENTRTVLLHRHLNTEAALVRLPYAVALGDDPFALPSLGAALQLGLREVYGGAPDHLGVVSVTDPASDNRESLLIYDSVPGGTGYLAELAVTAQLWQILARALDILRACSCEDEARLSCHRCLLPFAAPYQREWTSRAAAIKHLEAMLGVEAGVPVLAEAWKIVEEPIAEKETESVLESRFRKAFREVADRLGAKITDIPGAFGNTIRVSLGTRTFTLASQVPLGHTRPDFLLSSEQLPDIAIYTDGWQYHASPEHNNIADDAHKREALRLGGTYVLAVTSQDLDAFDKGEKADPPAWFVASRAQKLNGVPQLQHNAAARDALIYGPMEFIAYWLQQHDVDNLTRFGRAVSALAYAGGGAAADALGKSAASQLGPSLPVRVWREGTFAVAVAQGKPGALPTVALLDDKAVLGSVEAKQGWLSWLAFANATMFLPATLAKIGANSDVLDPAESVAPVDVVHSAGQFSMEWQPFVDELGDEAFALLEALAAGGLTPPDAEVGHELGGGIPFDLVWTTQRIAVQLDPGDDLQALKDEGWRVFGDEPEQIIEAWKVSNHG